MRRIVKETTNEGEIRYACEETRTIEGETVWRALLKFDVSMERYTPAIFTSMRQAESFMRNKPYTLEVKVVKTYEY